MQRGSLANTRELGISQYNTWYAAKYNELCEAFGSK